MSENQLVEHSSADGKVIDFTAAERTIAASNNLPEIREIWAQVEAVRAYAAKRGKESLEVINRAVQLQLRAERKMGGLLQEMELRGGRRRGEGKRKPTLESMGVTTQDSYRWQQVTGIPESVFEQYLTSGNSGTFPLSRSALLKLIPEINDLRQSVEQAIREATASRQKYKCVLIVPLGNCLSQRNSTKP